MRKLSALLVALALFQILAHPLSAQTKPWVTAYHPTWWYGALTPSMIDFNSITHIIIFPAQDASSSAPYFNSAGIDDGRDYPQIVSLAHAKGAKVILSVVGGYGQTNMPVVAADAAKCQAFVDAACAYAKSKNADGIELDWEFPRSGDKVGWNRLISLFRQQLDTWTPRGILMTSMYYNIGGADTGPYQRDAMVAAFDQINPMTYTMWMGAGAGPYHAGFDTPVNLPTQFSGYVGYSLSNPRKGGPLSFIDAGYPASKIGVAISFEGTRFGGVSTLGPQYSSWAFVSSATRPLGTGYAAIPTSGRSWDPVAQANYCVSGSNVYSFQDTNSVKAIASWAKQQGFGGIMIYDLGPGYDQALPVPDAMLKMAARVMLNGVTNPVGATGTFTADNTSLPEGGGTVQLSWTSANAVSASIDQGIGTVPLTGTVSVSVTSSTTFHLTLTDSSGTPTVLSVAIGVGVPDPPAFVYPANGQTNVPVTLKVQWHESDGAARYHIQLSTDSTFQGCTVNDSSLVDTARVVGPLQASRRYYRRVRAAADDGTWGVYSARTTFRTGTLATPVEDQPTMIPAATRLMQNYPNPFNPTTAISYEVAPAGHVRLVISDILGRAVETLVNEQRDAGRYTATWNAAGRASGVYFITLTMGNFRETQRMVLSK